MFYVYGTLLTAATNFEAPTHNFETRRFHQLNKEQRVAFQRTLDMGVEDLWQQTCSSIKGGFDMFGDSTLSHERDPRNYSEWDNGVIQDLHGWSNGHVICQPDRYCVWNKNAKHSLSEDKLATVGMFEWYLSENHRGFWNCLNQREAENFFKENIHDDNKDAKQILEAGKNKGNERKQMQESERLYGSYRKHTRSQGDYHPRPVEAEIQSFLEPKGWYQYNDWRTPKEKRLYQADIF